MMQMILWMSDDTNVITETWMSDDTNDITETWML